MSFFWIQILFLTAIYLFGSLPTGVLLARWYGTPDPRSSGSGSVGTTNMLRLGGRKVAALTFAIDVFKGFIAVLVTFLFIPNLYQFAGMVVVFGHIFPIWLTFKGGKGVAPALGVLFAWSPLVALTCLITWGVLLATTRYVSVGSLGAVLVAPLAAYLLHEQLYTLAILMLALMIIFSHRQNILRLIKGKEPKVGDTSNTPQKPGGAPPR